MGTLGPGSAGAGGGDGYPDIIVHRGYNNLRDDPTDPDNTTWMKRVLLNRPGGTGRTFVDLTVESRYGQTRDGSGLGRSAQNTGFGDIDNDGDIDALSLTWVNTDPAAPADTGDRTSVLLNDGHGVFTLAPPSERAGLTSTPLAPPRRCPNLPRMLPFHLCSHPGQTSRTKANSHRIYVPRSTAPRSPRHFDLAALRDARRAMPL